MESLFLPAEELCRRHPGALKAFEPAPGPYPFTFVATDDTVILGNIRHHLVLAFAALPPFPMDPTSLFLRAASMDTRHEVVGLVRPRIKVAGAVDVTGIIRSYDCPSLSVYFDEFARGYEAELYRNDLRATIFDFVDARRRPRRSA